MKTVSKFAFTALLAGAMIAPLAANANTSDKTAQQVFTKADTDRSGSVNLTEYTQYKADAQESTTGDAKDEFASLDVNKDNKLSMAEMQAAKQHNTGGAADRAGTMTEE